VFGGSVVVPLVFVHGVGNRLSGGYSAGQATRDALFRRFLLRDHRRGDGSAVVIENPFWGDLGGRLYWGGASLPLEDFEALGGDDAVFIALHAAAQPDDPVTSADAAVLEVARGSLPDAIDLLWSASALTETGEAEALAALAVRAAAYAAAHPHPTWLADVANDQQLVTRLEQERDSAAVAAPAEVAPVEWESLGGVSSAWQAIRRGAARLDAAVTGVVGREASERIRPAVIPGLTGFLGDIFVYLHQQNEVAGPIRNVVGGAIRKAAADADQQDPLVVVAHSMGGNIVYDLLTSELDDVVVDLFVTAGTQVGFFEELKLFRSSDRSVPGPDRILKVPRPASIRRWVNVFDYSDLLGFQVGSVINGVDDYSYRTGSLLKAHSEYFLQPSFHERLAARVRGAQR
jgi:hypothetical protein